jgi:hypothetical protein
MYNGYQIKTKGNEMKEPCSNTAALHQHQYDEERIAKLQSHNRDAEAERIQALAIDMIQTDSGLFIEALVEGALKDDDNANALRVLVTTAINSKLISDDADLGEFIREYVLEYVKSVVEVQGL